MIFCKGYEGCGSDGFMVVQGGLILLPYRLVSYSYINPTYAVDHKLIRGATDAQARAS
jgi:hypothetical protein